MSFKRQQGCLRETDTIFEFSSLWGPSETAHASLANKDSATDFLSSTASRDQLKQFVMEGKPESVVKNCVNHVDSPGDTILQSRFAGHLVLTVPTTNDEGHWEWFLVYDWEAIDVTDTNLVSKLINWFSYGIDQNVLRNLIRKERLQKTYD